MIWQLLCTEHAHAFPPKSMTDAAAVYGWHASLVYWVTLCVSVLRLAPVMTLVFALRLDCSLRVLMACPMAKEVLVCTHKSLQPQHVHILSDLSLCHGHACV